MRLPVAARLALAGLLRGDRTRVVAALAGVTVSIFVVVMHVAFLRGVSLKSTAFYDLFDYDAVIVSERFQFFYVMPPFSVGRVLQAEGLSSVAQLAQVRVTSTDWLALENLRSSTLIVFSFSGAPEFIVEPTLRAAAGQLDRQARVVVDNRSDVELGPLATGRRVQIAGHDATISGTYRLGLRMYADGTAMVMPTDFSYFGGFANDRVSLGLVKFRPGADRQAAMAELATLPKDVRAYTREQLREGERAFFVEVKPLGVLMRSGVWIGFVVGLVALYQALATHLESRVREFAVLRAMGHSKALVLAVGALQLALMTVVGALLASAVLAPTLGWLEKMTTFDVAYQPVLWGYTFVAALALATGSGIFAMWRVQRMDPADLL